MDGSVVGALIGGGFLMALALLGVVFALGGLKQEVRALVKRMALTEERVFQLWRSDGGSDD